MTTRGMFKAEEEIVVEVSKVLRMEREMKTNDIRREHILLS